MTLTSVQYGFVVGAIPTACMLLSSAFISQYEISKIVEAILQNFSAGLILAAVGGELFPLLYLDKSPADTAIGITLGFAFGLALNYGLDAFVEQFEDDEDDDDEGDKKVKHLGEHAEGREILAKNAEYYKKLGGVSGIEMSMDDIELSNKKEKIRKDTTPSPSSSMKKSDVNSVNNTGDVEMADMGGQYGQITSDGSRKPRSDSNQSNNDSIPNAGSDAGSDEDRGDKQFESTKGLRTALGYKDADVNSIQQWDDEPINTASRAISDPNHRSHIRGHVAEFFNEVCNLESKCTKLITESTSAHPTGPGIDNNQNPMSHAKNMYPEKGMLTIRDSDQLAEEMDEAVHKLQYMLDHCRRLLQGTEFDFNLSDDGLPSWAKLTVIDLEQKNKLAGKIRMMKMTAEHIAEHISAEVQEITPSDLKEIYIHMDEMHHLLEGFHENIENVPRRWTRRRELMMPEEGDTLPFGLIIPVSMDCLTDGLLIGIACAVNPKTGIILGFANCLEMGSLGMAYACRLNKCTSSSLLYRNIALYGAPLLMFLAAGLGALIASAAEHVPSLFVAFVAFGCVALLSLVCNELIVEAAKANEEDGEDRWYVPVMIILGVYCVLMLSLAF